MHPYVGEYIKSLPDLKGKVVLDIPCGDGEASYEFYQKGAIVKAFDLYPEFMKTKSIEAKFADLTKGIPLENNSVDYILCEEGIEHISDQVRVFQEFNRVLKKDGELLITTPNASHFRARLARFFLESDSLKKMPATEIDSIWFAEEKSNRLYFGHLFLLGVQDLQTIAAITGFQVRRRLRTDFGRNSLLIGIVLYPILVVITLLVWSKYRKKNKKIAENLRKTVLWQRVKLNIAPTTLFYKHIFWIMAKRLEQNEIIGHLKIIKRKKYSNQNPYDL